MSEQKDKKPSGFDMSEAWDDVIFSDSAKDKALAGLKFLGKGLFNTAKFVADTAPKVANASEKVADNVIRTHKSEVKRIESRLKDSSLTDAERSALERRHNELMENISSLEEKLENVRNQR